MSLLLQSNRLLGPIASTSLSRKPHSAKRQIYTSAYQAMGVSKALLWSCIGANVAVFGAWQYSADTAGQRPSSVSWFSGVSKDVETAKQRIRRILNQNFLIHVSDISKGRYWTMITSAFSHQGLYHLLGNMISLYTFGSVVLYSIASPLHLGALITGATLSGSLGFLWHARSNPRGQTTYGLGASGVVMGVGTAAALLRPFLPMQIFFVPAPLWAILLGYTLYDAFYLDNPQSRTGHAAHLGGAAFGAVYYALFLRRFGGVLSRF